MRGNRTSNQWQRWSSLILVVIAFAGLFSASLTLQAQDDSPLPPDGVANQLFLPVVNRGASEPAGSDLIAGQYIVVLHEPTVRAAQGNAESAATFADRVAQIYGGEILYTYDTALSGFAATLPPEAVSALETDPNVAYVEPDRVMTAIDTQTPVTWGLDRIDQRALPMDGSYLYNTAGAGVHAYIIDTGIRATHQQFTGRIGAGATFVSDGQGTNDCNGHGTHVAGTVGGSTHGVAKQVTLHAVRVLGCTGSGTTAGVIAGINWVAQNRVLPAVANMSLGGSPSASLDTAVANAVTRGIVFVVAAGNENADACNASPARAPTALTVGATTSTDSRASYSNYGACLDLFAPGSSITSAYKSSDTAIASMSGTSMASPHVAGAAALYLSANPSQSPAQVAEALMNHATPDKVSDAQTGSPNRLLYTAFIGNGSPPTPTHTPTPTAVPTQTPTGTPPPVVGTPTPTATPSDCSNLLANPGFEQGRALWSESSARGYSLICTKTGCGNAITPHTGLYESWLGGGNNETAELRQTVALPAGRPAYLTFWHQIGSADYCNYDYAYVRIIASGVTTTLKTFKLCLPAKTTTWIANRVDISRYAGKSVTLIFRVKTDASMVSNFFVDDTAVVNSNTCALTYAVDEIMAAAANEPSTEYEGDEDLVTSAEAKPEAPAGPEEFGR